MVPIIWLGLLENKTSVKTSGFGQYIFRSFHLDHNLDQTFRSLKTKTSDSYKLLTSYINTV